MGLYFEEFVLNVPMTTRGRTIGEGDIATFAGLVGDWNPLHIDEEYSSRTEFGGRIAHGPLCLSVAIGLMSQLNLIDATAMALLNVRWDFKAPVKIGDTIHALVTPVEKRAAKKPDRGVVTLGFEIKNQRGVTVQAGTATLLMKSKAHPDAAG